MDRNDFYFYLNVNPTHVMLDHVLGFPDGVRYSQCLDCDHEIKYANNNSGCDTIRCRTPPRHCSCPEPTTTLFQYSSKTLCLLRTKTSCLFLNNSHCCRPKATHYCYYCSEAKPGSCSNTRHCSCSEATHCSCPGEGHCTRSKARHCFCPNLQTCTVKGFPH